MPSNPFKSPKAPKVPTPVDPRLVITEQARVDRYNTRGPFGSVTWSGNPASGRMTQTTRLDPSQQRQLRVRNNVAESMLTGYRPEARRLAQDPFSFDEAGGRAARALFEREKSYLDPEREYQAERMDQKLANMGLPMGSEAYDEETRRFDQNWNDAYTRAAQTAEITGADLAERERARRFNEVAAVMGTQQVTPTGSSGGNQNVASAYQLNQNGQNLAYNAEMARYNQQVQQQQATQGALMRILLGGFPS